MFGVNTFDLLTPSCLCLFGKECWVELLEYLHVQVLCAAGILCSKKFRIGGGFEARQVLDIPPPPPPPLYKSWGAVEDLHSIANLSL